MQVLHDTLLHKMFTLPMAFFDTQPPGRLLSRFSRDVANTDLTLYGLYLNLFEFFVGMLITAGVVIGITNGVVLLALLPLAPVYVSVTRRYLLSSRELNRLQMIAHSPVLSHFEETFAGLMSIRAFRKQVRHSLQMIFKAIGQNIIHDL